MIDSFEKLYPTPRQLIRHFTQTADDYGFMCEPFYTFSNFHCTFLGKTTCVRHVRGRFLTCVRGWLPNSKRDDYVVYNNSWVVISSYNYLQQATDEFKILCKEMFTYKTVSAVEVGLVNLELVK